jgi:ATP-dependent DNA ligase
MLCQTKKYLHHIVYPAIAQVKYDGARIIIYREDNTVAMFTRNGKRYTKLPLLEEQLLKLPASFVYDGELVFANYERKQSNGLARKAHSDGKITKAEAALAVVRLWDMVDVKGYEDGFSAIPYLDRCCDLNNACHTISTLAVNRINNFTVNKIEDCERLFYATLANGQEGIIVKNRYSPWENRRSPQCIKFKNEQSCELRIIAAKEGEGKNSNMLGALHCVSDDGHVDVWVGSGLTDAVRIDIWNNWEKYFNQIVEVKYNEVISAQGRNTFSLYLPVFMCVRTDKHETSTIEEMIT